MSQRVQIDYDKVDQIAKEFLTGKSNIEQEVTRLQGQISSLDDWTGQASTAFKSNWEGYRDQITKMAPILESISKELSTIASNFRQADTAGRG